MRSKLWHRRTFFRVISLFVCDLGLHAASHALAQDWVLTGAPQTNWNSVACSANGRILVAAGSDFQYGGGRAGYISFSTNSGTNWTTPIVPSNFWTAVTVSADGTRMAAVSGSEWNPQPLPRIYISSDTGATWQQANVPTNTWRSVACSADGSRLVAVALNGDIYTSLDTGQNWLSTNLPAAWADVACSANGTGLVAVSSGAIGGYNGSGRVYFSGDFGQSWFQPANENITWPEWVSVAASADHQKLVAGGSVAFTGHCCPCANVCTSSDGGTNVHPTTACVWYWDSVASSADGSRLAAGQAGGGPLFLSSDSGTNWIQSGSFPGPTFVACSADGRKLVVAVYDGGIYTLEMPPASPVLKIRRAGAAPDLLISWPVPSSNFALQQSPTLAPGSWTDVNTPSSLDYSSLQYYVRISSPAGSLFYRLVSR